MYNGNEFFGLHSKGKSIELLLLKEIADFQNVVTIIETWQKAFFLNWVLLAALLELPIIKKTCKWWTIKKTTSSHMQDLYLSFIFQPTG